MEIRTRWQTDPGVTKMGMAKEYGVSDTSIYNVLKGLTKSKATPQGKIDVQVDDGGKGAAGGNGSKDEELPELGSGTKFSQKLNIPIHVYFFYEDAKRRGYAGSIEEYIGDIVLLFHEYQGLTIGIVRIGNDGTKSDATKSVPTS